MTAYPPAARGGDVDVLHGRIVPDPYRGLERDTEDTLAWTRAQSRLVDAYFEDCEVRDRLAARLAVDETPPAPTPIRVGDREFLPPHGDGDRGMLRMRRPDGVVVILCDPRRLDPDGHTVLHRVTPSPDGRRVVCQLSRLGVEYGRLLVIDADTGTVLDGPIGPVRYSSIAWLPDGSAFFFVAQTPESVASAGTSPDVVLHRLGTEDHASAAVHTPTSGHEDGDVSRPAVDPVALDPAAPGPAAFDPAAAPNAVSPDLLAAIARATEGAASISVRIDRGRWLLLHCGIAAGGGNQVWIADLADLAAGQPAGAVPPGPLLRRVTEGVDARTHAEVGPDGLLYLLTSHRAPTRRLCRVEPGDPRPDRWREVVPALPDATLTSVTVLEHSPVLVVLRLLDGVHEASLHDRASGRRLRTVALPGAGRITRIAETGPREVRLGYTDFVTPPGEVRCDLVTGFCRPATRSAARSVPTVGTRRLRCRSADGTSIRLVLLGRTADLTATSPRPLPTLLTAYGGFGIPAVPAYDPELLAWVAEGGLVAIACVRGGGDEGAAWHRAGTRERKQNTFDDLHAAAEWLIAEGRTSPDRLGVLGSSNGGLLVGAAVTQRPDLFAAGVSRGGVLDMIRSELFGLGPLWREEYGSVQDGAEFRALLAYSPYHRVRPGVHYPATLFVAAEQDTRVHPMHARKMCAAMQHADPEGRPILYRSLAASGHVEHSRRRAVAVAAETLAFLARETGLANDRGRPVPSSGTGHGGARAFPSSPSGSPVGGSSHQ